MSPGEIAKVLGGEVVRGAVLAPGPGHSRKDRSLSIKVSANSPDGLLVHSFAGDDFRECRDYVLDRLGLSQDGWRDRRGPRPTRRHDGSMPKPHDDPDLGNEARIARAVAIWDQALDPRGTLVETYLAGRSIDLDDEVAGSALRFHPVCPWRDQEREVTIYVPVMLAAMRQVVGDQITGIHRTRLSPEGLKLGRRMLGIAAGAAIKLDGEENVTASLSIGEGIETSLSGRQFGFRPAWAMGSANAIRSLPVLPGVEALSLFTERDETNARACRECAERWHTAEREIRMIEPKHGKDLNDSVRGQA